MHWTYRDRRNMTPDDLTATFTFADRATLLKNFCWVMDRQLPIVLNAAGSSALELSARRGRLRKD